MAKKLDPYATLGIDRSASPSEIKAAYRKRAMKAHPDRGGSTDEFNKVNRANIVLSDPKRRSKYDRTGEIDDDSPNNVLSAPLGIILGFVQAACVQYANNQGGDPCGVDFVALMQSHFRKTISDLETQKKRAVRISEKFKNISVRLKAKGKTDGLLHRAMLTQADAIASQVQMTDQQIAAHKDAIEMLHLFTFEFDKAPSNQFPTSNFFTRSF